MKDANIVLTLILQKVKGAKKVQAKKPHLFFLLLTFS